jgi:hypothetical protein
VTQDAADRPIDEAPRWIEVDGRRWRATDPSIPAPLRQELVDELMAARRAIGALGRHGDEGLVADARRRVHAAKVALGERGEPWWDEPSDDGQRARLAAAIEALAGHRAPDRTICPSDAARAVGGERWRSVMPLAREVAVELVGEGRVEVLQRGEVIDAAAGWRGPVRIRAVRSGGSRSSSP